jgi:hypothetical protein
MHCRRQLCQDQSGAASGLNQEASSGCGGDDLTSLIQSQQEINKPRLTATSTPQCCEIRWQP